MVEITKALSFDSKLIIMDEPSSSLTAEELKKLGGIIKDLRSRGITGKELQDKLDEVHITINKNAIPNDPESPFVTSGMRIGTPAVTTRGFGAPEMLRIAEFIWQAATDFDNKANDIRRNVRDICANFPIY